MNGAMYASNVHNGYMPSVGGAAMPMPPLDPTLPGANINGSGYYDGNHQHYASHPHHLSGPAQPPLQQPEMYSQGPQGDPFAQAQAMAVSIISSPKTVRRSTKYREHKTCYACGNPAQENKDGQVEALRGCAECGRSVHPTCLELDSNPEFLFSYDWTCNQCKRCTICDKAKEEGMLLCDHCDRGWHDKCLIPPLDGVPEGKWHCPECPPLDPPEPSPEEQPISDFPPDGSIVPPESLIDPSIDMDVVPETPQDEEMVDVATIPSSSPPRPTIRGRGVVVVSSESEDDESEDDSNHDVDVGASISISRPSRSSKARSSKSRSRKRPATVSLAATSATPARPAKKTKTIPPPTRSSPVRPRIKLTLGTRANKQKDEEEERKSMFDDILSEADRDTSKTVITGSDKNLFEKSRQAAEARLQGPKPTEPEDQSDVSAPGPSSRPLRSQVHSSHLFTGAPPSPGPFGSPAPSTPGGYGKGKTKAAPASEEKKPLRIKTIRFSDYDIGTWYDAPFPEEYNNLPDGRMWICEYCLKYMKSGFVERRHKMKCKCVHPPGDEIYRDGAISVFEIDGRKNKIYCQNLCLLSKMFLDHKSLFYDVEPFLFYVMTETDDDGAHFIGYFSKEKRSPNNYNVSCIMTLPVRQRRGWGNLLIDFSYLLSKKEQRPGSPEKPLSDLGALGYRNYWTLALMRYFSIPGVPEHPRLEDISAATAMTLEDIYNTLHHLQLVQVVEDTPPPPKPLPGQSFKFPKGRKNGLARRSSHRPSRAETPNASRASPAAPPEPTDPHKPRPFVAPDKYTIACPPEKAREWLTRWEAKNYVQLKPEKLRWSPFLVAHVPKADGPASLPVGDETGGDVATPSALETGEIVVDAVGLALAHPSDNENGTIAGGATVTGGKVPRRAHGVPQPPPDSPQTPSVEKSSAYTESVRSTRSTRSMKSDMLEWAEEKDGVLPVMPAKVTRRESTPRVTRSRMMTRTNSNLKAHADLTPTRPAFSPRRSSRRAANANGGSPEVMRIGGHMLNADEASTLDTLLALKSQPSPIRKVAAVAIPPPRTPSRTPTSASTVGLGVLMDIELGDEDAEGEDDIDAEGEPEE